MSLTPPQHDSPGVAIAHMPALDGLRGLVIALVLVIHFVVVDDFPRHLPGTFSDWLNRVSYGGWVGVDLFVVLSGFLITSPADVTKGPALLPTFLRTTGAHGDPL